MNPEEIQLRIDAAIAERRNLQTEVQGYMNMSSDSITEEIDAKWDSANAKLALNAKNIERLQAAKNEAIAEQAARDSVDNDPNVAPRQSNQDNVELDEDSIRQQLEEFIGATFGSGARDSLGDNIFYGGYVQDASHLMGNNLRGGATVANERFINEMIKTADMEFPIYRLTRKFPLRGSAVLSASELVDDIEDPIWTDEINSNITTQAVQVGRRNLGLHPKVSLIKISRTLMYHNPQFADYVMGRASYKHGSVKEYATLFGTGDKQPLGILVPNAAGVNSDRFIETETSLTIDYNDFVNTLTHLRPAYRSGCIWVISRDVEADLMKLEDTAGNKIWRGTDSNPMAAAVGAPGTILGRPYFVHEHLVNKTSGAWVDGDYPVAVFNPSYYWHTYGENMEFQRLEELYATSNQMGFLHRESGDGAPVVSEAFAVMEIKG